MEVQHLVQFWGAAAFRRPFRTIRAFLPLDVARQRAIPRYSQPKSDGLERKKN